MIETPSLPYLAEVIRIEIRATDKATAKIEKLRLALEKRHPLKTQKEENHDGR